MRAHYRRTDQKSYFDGGLLGYIGWFIFGALITFFTLGLAAPWAIVNMYRWEINHTVIDGKRLEFSGTGWGTFRSMDQMVVPHTHYTWDLRILGPHQIT